ncbi:unnamed protein product [Rotaria sp. Silwood2]|nr:unnamed protein product [Rotaria sp. Silwood2]
MLFSEVDGSIQEGEKYAEIHTVSTYLSDLFATKFTSDTRNNEHLYRDPFNDELIQLCPSYPKYCVVPSTITNEEIREAAKFRSYKQFPTIVWRHINGAIIARVGQPEVGWPLRHSKEDENMIQAIINSHNDTLTTNSIESGKNLNRLLILHVGSHDAAIKNYAKYHINCNLEFMALPDIHAISRNARMLRASNTTQCENWLSELTLTHWLHNLSVLIKAACCAVTNVDEHNRSVLVHCSNGQDHTSTMITLAEIMLDSHYLNNKWF